MSSYTTTLRKLMDPAANSAGYNYVAGHYDNGVWIPATITKNSVSTTFELWETGDKAYPLIFDDPDWEGYDPTFRSSLNSKIVDYYWGYEIGSETPAMFKQRINARMRLIMPYYNLLFKAQWEQLRNFNPNLEYRKIKEYQGGTNKNYGARKQYDHSGSATYGLGENGDILNEGKQYNFDTPQNLNQVDPDSPNHMSSAAAVKNVNGKTYTKNGFYGGEDQVNFDESKPTFKTDAAIDTETFNNRKDVEYGYNGDSYGLYKEYLEEIRNIERMIIDELRDCFMLCY